MSTVIKHKQFPNHKVYETTVAGRPLKIEVGKMAELANASSTLVSPSPPPPVPGTASTSSP